MNEIESPFFNKNNPTINQGKILLEKQLKNGIISLPALKVIHDLSDSSTTEMLQKDSIQLLEKTEPKNLEVLHKYLNMIDIAEGLLVCTECGRWFPIGCAVESIPELMPDELREREPELTWLEKWSNKIPANIIKNGLPFKP